MLSDQPPLGWQPISGLCDSWPALTDHSLAPLTLVWNEQKKRLGSLQSGIDRFVERLVREAAIETGQIEGLYTLDRGITQVLIEQGLHESLIPGSMRGRAPTKIIALLHDQEDTINGLFDFVTSQRRLTTSYIKAIHQQITQHQYTTHAITPEGHELTIQLLRGDWKKNPNNPRRPDGKMHFYCPPEHVASEMDRLLDLCHAQQSAGMAAEVIAAWLHHRFTQIHPFQDGNGRVARLLASLVMIQTGLFPLVVSNNQRTEYISALEQADHDDDLRPLVALFVTQEKEALLQAFGLSANIISEKYQSFALIQKIASKIKAIQVHDESPTFAQVQHYADRLFNQLGVRIKNLKQELQSAIPSLEIHQNSAKHGDARAQEWNRYPVIQAARKYAYFANLRDYSGWLCVKLGGAEDTEVLFSFHVPGEIQRGIIVCVAVAYIRSRIESEASYLRDFQELTPQPFMFSYADNEATLEERYAAWLENAIVAGLVYWGQNGL